MYRPWQDKRIFTTKPEALNKNQMEEKPEQVLAKSDTYVKIWLPPRDSNPDMLIQSQLSCR